MEETNIRSLSDTSFELILQAFQKAFSDYAVCFSSREIEAMLRRRGCNKHLSFAAFNRDNEIVSFLLNGYGMYRGNLTCYDCGTGTIPEYRGCGLAGKLFEASVPTLKNSGVAQYVLEVLKSNASAISVYKRIGFEVTADYKCYNQQLNRLVLDKVPDLPVQIRKTGADAVSNMSAFCDFQPSWQNDFESLRRGSDCLIALKAEIEDNPVGYCVFDAWSGDISQLAVSPQYRRKGIGTALLSAAVREFKTSTIKVINVESSCSSLAEFLCAANFAEGLAQFGMTKHL